MPGLVLSRKLDRLQAAIVSRQAALVAPLPPVDDSPEVAAELAASFGRLVEEYRNHYKLSPKEAENKALEQRPEWVERALSTPPGEVTWDDLGTIADHDHALALERWEEVKEAVRSEVESGHWMAKETAGFNGSCQDRADYLAIRAELSDAWRPVNGLEQLLIDQAAVYQVLLARQLGILAGESVLIASGIRREIKANERNAHRPTVAEAHDRTAGMVERLHRLLLRTLKALQDLRQVRPVVVRCDYVNIAQQQVNVSR